MCLTFEEDYQNIVILADSKMKNANRAFDLKGHLAIKSVLEKLKLSGDMYQIRSFLQLK